MKTVLITGSEGNIGRYLVRYFEQHRPDISLIRVKLNEGGVEKDGIENLYVGDLRDKDFTARIFQENKIDCVIHLAAKLYGVAGFNKDVFGILENDLECLLHVLGLCREVEKFIYLSSSMVYESSDDVPFTEDMTDRIMPPRSSYGLTKYLGEKAVKFFNQQYGNTYTIWRPFNVVSPLESHFREGGHVFVDFYRKIFVERVPKIEIYGNGNQVRCFTWVEDVVSAIGGSVDDPKTDNETFNVGSNEPKNMFELKDMLLDIGKNKGYLPSEYSPETITGNQFFGVDVQMRIPSVEKIRQVLGWECKTDFRTCFGKFVDYKQKENDNS